MKKTLLTFLLSACLFVPLVAQEFSENFDGILNEDNITTTNTDLTYVRVGTQGGSITSLNPGNFTDASAVIIGPTGGSLNGFGVGSELTPSEAYSFSMDIKVTNDSGNIVIGVGAGNRFTGNSAFATTQGLFWLRLHDGELQRRQGTSWVNTGYEYSVGDEFTLYIAANGSSTDAVLDYNGAGNDLNPGRMDIWINGTLVDEDVPVTNTGLESTGFRVYSVNESNAEFDNIELFDLAPSPFSPSVFAERFDLLDTGPIDNTDTNLDYVRVGTGGGSIDGVAIGSFDGPSIAITGPSTTSLNGIGVQNSLSVSDVYTLGFDARITKDDGGIVFGLGSGTSFTGNSGFNTAQGLFWFEFRDGNLRVRQGGDWIPTSFSYTENQLMTIHIVANGSVDNILDYDGNGQNLDAGKMDVYINNVLVEDGIDVTNSLVVNGFRFYSISGSDVEIDNIYIWNEARGTRYNSRTITVDGDKGWRYMGSPAEGTTLANLASQSHIQGVPGSNFGFDTNIYTGYNGSNWLTPSSINNRLEMGKGFVWYFFNTGSGTPSDPLPLDITFEGNFPETEVRVPMHDDGDRFNLVSNPFNEDLNWNDVFIANDDAAGDGTIDASYYVWDSAINSYLGYNHASGDGTGFEGLDQNNVPIVINPNGGEIAVGQSFVFANIDRDFLTIPTNAKTGDDDATFYGENEFLTRIGFSVFDNDRFGYAVAAFHPDGKEGWDNTDMMALYPLSNSFILMGFENETIYGDTGLLFIDSKNQFLEREISMPLHFIASTSGEYELTWPEFTNVPDDWSLTLIDREMSSSIDLRDFKSYTFSYMENFEIDPQNIQPNNPVVPSVNQLGSARFELIISPFATNTQPINELPSDLTLNQNYPNPFNPTTNISFALPQSGDVRLEVFNMLGQRVGVLADGFMQAGRHTVAFDASALSSGVYVYRLQTGSTVLSKKMTLIK